MRFDATLAKRWSRTGDGWRCEIPDGWMQGRSVFGGLTVALSSALGRQGLVASRSLRTVSAQLIRPMSPGAVEATVRTVRDGKTVTFVEVRLSQEARETVSVSLAYVEQREGGTDVSAPIAVARDPGSLPEMPYIPGVMPEFTQHVALRWATGSLPYAGGAEARYEGYCRFREPAGDVEGLIGLLDAWPCPSLSLLKSPTPASTISWTAHLLHVPESFDGWFAFASETVAGEGGFHTSVGRLHAPDGRLAAWSEQLVAIFG